MISLSSIVRNSFEEREEGLFIDMEEDRVFVEPASNDPSIYLCCCYKIFCPPSCVSEADDAPDA